MPPRTCPASHAEIGAGSRRIGGYDVVALTLRCVCGAAVPCYRDDKDMWRLKVHRRPAPPKSIDAAVVDVLLEPEGGPTDV